MSPRSKLNSIPQIDLSILGVIKCHVTSRVLGSLDPKYHLALLTCTVYRSTFVIDVTPREFLKRKPNVEVVFVRSMCSFYKLLYVLRLKNYMSDTCFFRSIYEFHSGSHSLLESRRCSYQLRAGGSGVQITLRKMDFSSTKESRVLLGLTFPWGKSVKAWSWPLTSTNCRG